MQDSQWWKKRSLSSSRCTGKNPSLGMYDKVLFSYLVVSSLVLNSPEAMADSDLLSKKYDFDIPGERADIALTTFAEQANLTLIFPYDKVKKIEAHRLSGHYSIDEAISILLLDTGLKMVVDANSQLMIIQNTNNQESEKMPKKSKLSTAIVAILS